MICTRLSWSNDIIFRLRIKQLLASILPPQIIHRRYFLEVFGWLHWTNMKECHSNSHCAVSLPQLTLRTQLNSVLGACAISLQTTCNRRRIFDILDICPWDLCGQTPPIISALHFATLVHVLLPLDFLKYVEAFQR